MLLQSGEYVRKCSCGLYFLSPRMDEGELKNFYGNGVFNNFYRNGKDHASFAQRRANMRYEKLRKYLRDRESILDIGCSDGYFLDRIPSRMKAVGIDPATRKENYIKGSFPEDMPEFQYDMITCFHVVEHLRDPVSFVGRVKDFLTDNGLFVLEYPDIERLLAKKDLSLCFHMAHLYDFSEKTIGILLKKAGFKILVREYYDGVEDSGKNVMVICGRIS